MEIIPLGDRVLVEIQAPEETTESGLLVVPTSKNNSNKGIVIAVGEEVKQIAKGDIVSFNRMSGSMIKNKDKDLMIFRAKDIEAKYIGE